MAGSYSTDLRERALVAMEAGETPGAAARRFAVGRSTAYRWAAAARDEIRRGARGPGGAGGGRQEDGRRPEAENQRRGGGRTPRPARRDEPPDPGGMPRPAGGADRRTGPSLDGGAGAAAVRLDVKEADLACGRARRGGGGRRTRRVGDGRGDGGGRRGAGPVGVPGRVRRADRHGPAARPQPARHAGAG